MTTFTVIKPVPITDAQLISSNIAEPALLGDADPAAWNAATNYAVKAQATRTALHKIYQRLVAGVTATAPELDPVNWVYVGTTNRWRMFDLANNTQSSAPDEIVVKLFPNAFADSLVVLNTDAQKIRLTVDNTDYDVVQGMESRVVNNWYDYFFTRLEAGRTEFVFEKLPLRLGNVLTLTISRPVAVARIGTVVVGLSKVLGTTKYGVSAGINDYSKKFVDDFGNVSIVPRPFSKRMTAVIVVLAGDVDNVHRFLTLNRQQLLVFVGANNEYSSLIVFGFFRSFDVVINYFTHSECALTAEGLI